MNKVLIRCVGFGLILLVSTVSYVSSKASKVSSTVTNTSTKSVEVEPIEVETTEPEPVKVESVDSFEDVLENFYISKGQPYSAELGEAGSRIAILSCKALDDGSNFESITEIIANNTSNKDLQFLAASSVGLGVPYYCPEYQDELDTYIESN